MLTADPWDMTWCVSRIATIHITGFRNSLHTVTCIYLPFQLFLSLSLSTLTSRTSPETGTCGLISRSQPNPWILLGCTLRRILNTNDSVRKEATYRSWGGNDHVRHFAWTVQTNEIKHSHSDGRGSYKKPPHFKPFHFPSFTFKSLTTYLIKHTMTYSNLFSLAGKRAIVTGGSRWGIKANTPP